MEPKPMLTVRFVKCLLLVFVVIILLHFSLPPNSNILGYFIGGAALLVMIFLQLGSPRIEVTVDDERIRFNRIYSNWSPLKKYYLNELVIPHSDWDSWVKIKVSDGEDDTVNYYLFFINERLCFAAKTAENNDLEYWVEKKFPDRPLQTKYRFGKYEDRYDNLKERHRMKVF